MYQYKCKINKVLDGDTVDIDLDLGFNIILVNQRVRMAGVDTPESRTADKEEKVRGLLSKKKLAEKLPVGSWQVIETQKSDNNDDKFGRILGVFLLEDGTRVNITGATGLVAGNASAVYFSYAKIKMDAEL